MLSVPSALTSSLTRLIARQRAVRAAIRTERLLGALPSQIRKDIGWPDLWNGPDRIRR
jgi:hypothetical protein